jgi:hypothetical protein
MSVPVTFAAATPPAWSPPPPAKSIVLAVGEAATAASQSQLDRDGTRSGRRSPRRWRPADITAGPAARPSKKDRGRPRQPCDGGHEKDRQWRLARQGDQISGPWVEHHQREGATFEEDRAQQVADRRCRTERCDRAGQDGDPAAAEG